MQKCQLDRSDHAGNQECAVELADIDLGHVGRLALTGELIKWLTNRLDSAIPAPHLQFLLDPRGLYLERKES